MLRPNVLLVGCGKMGGALLRRWQKLKLYNDICIVEPTTISVLAAKRVSDFAQIPPAFRPDVVVMAVKPQTLPEILGRYKALTDKGALLLTIAAGRPISYFEQALGRKARVVRAMPNIPASIGEGITVACANRNVTKAQREQATSLLSAVGEMLWVEEEKLLDPVTALSGSGPAYVFLLTEALAKAGQKIGLDAKMAEKLARQTVIGSAALAKASPDQTPSRLRENVTSPGGTTEAALKILMADNGIQKLFDKALDAATKRAGELSK
jgi:pyrroline-5-carboxylate reductase